jgi:hypothetical protein
MALNDSLCERGLLCGERLTVPLSREKKRGFLKRTNFFPVAIAGRV